MYFYTQENMEIFIKKYWGLFFVIIFSFITILPLFHSGFFSMHDDTQVARVFEMGKSIKDGMFPVRWVQDLGYGYGYPVFTFYAPFAYYFGAVFLLVGFSALTATKLMIGSGILLAVVAMYFFARDFWGEVGGVVSGLLYIYAPYHALDIYVRGDVAEFWAYALLPCICFSLWSIFQTQKTRYVIFGAISFAMLICSHNLSALMTTPFLLAFILMLGIFSKNKKISNRFLPIISLLLGILLAGFYWFPVPFEMHYTNVLSQVGGAADFRLHFVCPGELWSSPWGYGGSAPGCIDGISFAIGKIYIAVAALALILLPFLFRQKKCYGWVVLTALLGSGISLFMLLDFSLPIWEFLKPLAFLQYPWRFFILVYFFLSFLSGVFFWFLLQKHFLGKKTLLGILFLITVAAILLVQKKYFIPQTYYSVASNYYTNTVALQWNASKLTDEYMPQHFQKPRTVGQIVTKRFILGTTTGKVQIQSAKTFAYNLLVVAKQNTTLHINIAYFPAWHVFLDGKHVGIKPTNTGMEIAVPKGQHEISIIYQSTLVETIGDYITIAGILLCVLAIIGVGRKKLHEKKDR